MYYTHVYSHTITFQAGYTTIGSVKVLILGWVIPAAGISLSHAEILPLPSANGFLIANSPLSFSMIILHFSC